MYLSEQQTLESTITPWDHIFFHITKMGTISWSLEQGKGAYSSPVSTIWKTGYCNRQEKETKSIMIKMQVNLYLLVI